MSDSKPDSVKQSSSERVPDRMFAVLSALIGKLSIVKESSAKAGWSSPLKQEMTMSMLYVGLDTHKNTISVAVAEDGRHGEVRSHGTIENTPACVDKCNPTPSTTE